VPRRDEQVSTTDADDEDLPTIADEQPVPRAAGKPPLPAPDDDAPTIDAAAQKATSAPSGVRVVPNVPVPTRPPSVAGMKAVPAPGPPPPVEDLTQTIGDHRSAFDMIAAKRPEPKPQDYDSTQYLISSVMPHPLAKPAEPPPQPVAAPPPPQPRPIPQPVELPKPPIMLLAIVGVVIAIVLGAAIYVIAR
jgi:hypothetical protein